MTLFVTHTIIHTKGTARRVCPLVFVNETSSPAQRHQKHTFAHTAKWLTIVGTSSLNTAGVSSCSKGISVNQGFHDVTEFLEKPERVIVEI